MQIYEAGWQEFEVIIFPFRKKKWEVLASINTYVIEREHF
jgi:hypothetical protein